MKTLVIVFLLLFSTSAYASNIIIGGWRTTEEQMGLLKTIENSVLILPQTYFPLDKASEEVFEELEKKRMAGKKSVIIGYSWGGLIARQFAEDHPEMVEKLICIGTPNSGYPLSPGFFFKVKAVVGKDIPTFAIAGSKSKRRWYLRGLNDGTVDIESALNLPRLDDYKIFPLSHLELPKSKEVLDQLFQWLK